MKRFLLLVIALCAAFLLTACELDFNLPEDTQPTTPLPATGVPASI